ncbi:hypothetical protein CPB84DRAFT_1223246 [Gymnopilus junonius]|uniref:Uncharacterized protein n=1 Tax=Gymnopilus junonius TaxID=109634 RepID=A0A9P5P0X0_GYMJU|nr:hypothetical protein CPB84DRAFT_1223246 [Gymnopilus junonius]
MDGGHRVRAQLEQWSTKDRSTRICVPYALPQSNKTCRRFGLFPVMSKYIFDAVINLQGHKTFSMHPLPSVILIPRSRPTNAQWIHLLKKFRSQLSSSYRRDSQLHKIGTLRFIVTIKCRRLIQCSILTSKSTHQPPLIIMNARDLSQTIRCCLYSTFSRTSSSLSKVCNHAWAEAVISPAKYALFQVLGFHFIRATGRLDVPYSITAAYAAKVGCFAGIALGAFYISLLARQRHSRSQDISNLGTSAAFSNLCKEMAYTVIASVIGASLHGLDDPAGLFFLATSGVLGPAVFLMILFGVLGIVIAITWCYGSLKHRCVLH